MRPLPFRPPPQWQHTPPSPPPPPRRQRGHVPATGGPAGVRLYAGHTAPWMRARGYDVLEGALLPLPEQLQSAGQDH